MVKDDELGWVYLVGSEGSDIAKIGYAANVEQRLIRLQTGSPVKLSILFKVRGDVRVERALHAAFAEYRTHGEWFRDRDVLWHCFDWLMECCLDHAEDAADELGGALDDHLMDVGVTPEEATKHAAEAIRYFAYGRSTGDWNQEHLTA